MVADRRNLIFISTLIYCLDHSSVNPGFQFIVPNRRTVKSGKLPAVPVQDKGWRGFYCEPPGKDGLRIHIDPDDFESAGPFCRELVDERFNGATVAAPFCPKLSQYDFRPNIDLGIIA